jgi:hypothetical protein
MAKKRKRIKYEINAPPKEWADNHLEKILNDLERANKNAEEDIQTLLEFIDGSENDDKRYRRSLVVKPVRLFKSEDLKGFNRKYSEDLAYGKDPYPRNWMLNDKRIAPLIQHTPGQEKRFLKFLIPIMNYVFNINRRRKERKELYPSGFNINSIPGLIELSKHLGVEKLYKNEWPYACIVANNDFYQDAAKDLGCTTRTVYYYFNAIKKAGIFKVLLDKRAQANRTIILTDGYFVGDDNNVRKVAFLKDTAACDQRQLKFPCDDN